MSEPSERGREMAEAFCGRHRIHPYVLDDLCQMFTAARAEGAAAERERAAQIAETEILSGEPWQYPEIFEASLRQLVEAAVIATGKSIAARIRSGQ